MVVEVVGVVENKSSLIFIYDYCNFIRVNSIVDSDTQT